MKRFETSARCTGAAGRDTRYTQRMSNTTRSAKKPSKAPPEQLAFDFEATDESEITGSTLDEEASADQQKVIAGALKSEEATRCGLRALFFDIDGVLHPTGIAYEDEAGGIYCDPDDQRFIWAAILAELLEPHPDVVLVCHSTWRHRLGFRGLRAILPPELAERLIGVTDLYVGREESIQAYVAQHGIAADAYVIIDNERGAFTAGTSQLVHVNSSTGISTPKARAAIATALERLRNSKDE
ncbi:HAD domain-containing protein [Noviherbaspirillum pedocola]|uniref:Uncharacterized protein n=1 Tax=Noviherbaspirillum pedocola TaxID=2801341 RepID=A0A934W7E1_9BURK|nr:HAD domain-containing protein [Noviherbaspirillum pedocola]MBK4737322.1 hypothetical protein [Noviherbaspirillum pedocola]